MSFFFPLFPSSSVITTSPLPRFHTP
jgi:hypothetical protein